MTQPTCMNDVIQVMHNIVDLNTSYNKRSVQFNELWCFNRIQTALDALHVVNRA